jgi:molybdate transport system substrate-binding protein
MIKSKLLIAVIFAAVSVAPAAVAQERSDATELRVVTSGGFAAAYDILAPQFERDTGIALITEYGSSSGESPTAIPNRLARGEKFDVVILADYALENLIDAGFVERTSRKDLVLSQIGMSVQAGAVKPDISTPEAFIQTLRDVESFGYSASASGTYLSTVLLPELGLWEELSPKGHKIVGERVGTVVASGEVEIGFQQISELLPIEGADYVGPIPDAYQKTTVFAAGITGTAGNRDAAQAMLSYMSSAQAADTIRATGLQPIVSQH